MILKLGTRRSLLAWAQSSWVAQELEKMNPGLKVELVGIETQGDRIQEIPLSKIEGKEFFVAELDSALLQKKIDLTVHSMKDLSLDRPSQICSTVVTKRENPRDVILFSSNILEKITQNKKIKIGTSSPRRLENIPQFLKRALPQRNKSKEGIQFEWIEIRGNVNSRVSRLHLEESSEKKLDGVVLAFAGLIRLWKDEQARESTMRNLLSGIKWMVLPLDQCPTAPAQGALAIECLNEDKSTLKIIQTIHDSNSSKNVLAEREILREWGGGCHQAFGATQIETSNGRSLLYIKGRQLNQMRVEEIRWDSPDSIKDLKNIQIVSWDGSEFKLNHLISNLLVDVSIVSNAKAIFVAHSRAVHDQININDSVRIWTSGVKSWFELAKKGYWVEGCAENLGFDHVKCSLLEDVLQLPGLKDWVVFTHVDAVKGWNVGRVIPTYLIKKDAQSKVSDELKKELLNATHLYWNSSTQYDLLSSFTKKEASHSCGMGKTFEHIKKQGQVKVNAFPTVKEWKKWLMK